ncbi:MAG: DUF4265 domain-containing protein [Chloroflexota bacterium]
MMELKKIRFKLTNAPFDGETLWAEPAGEMRYRLRNIPLYVEGYAESDIVACRAVDGWHEVTHLVTNSGNGTIRILFADANQPEAVHILNELTSIGCTYEQATNQWVAVTVPPDMEVPFSQMSNYLNATDDTVLIGWEVAKRPIVEL